MKFSKIPIYILKNIIVFSSGYLTCFFFQNVNSKKNEIKVLQPMVEKINEMNNILFSVSKTISELKTETNHLKELKIKDDKNELNYLKNKYLKYIIENFRLSLF